MAERKPLVIVNGQIQQIQAGDTLQGISNPAIVTLVNGNANAIVIGSPVYASAAGTVDLAQADDVNTSEVVGLVSDASVANGANGSIQTGGILTATTGQWDTITGETGGLVANTVYFLDPSAEGKLTVNAPTTDGHLVSRIGKGLSTTQLEIAIQPPILL